MNSLEKGKISSYETFMLLFTLVVATGILFVPAITAVDAGPDGWIGLVFISTFYGIFVALLIGGLYNRFPSQTLVQYSEEILGKYLGKLLNFYLIFTFVAINAIVVREFTVFLVSAFMPQTPVSVFMLTIILLGVSFVRNGLEVIARANIFIAPIAFVAFLFIVFLQWDSFQLSNLFPVLEQGIKPVLKGSLVPMAWRGEILLFAMFLPYLNKPMQGTKISILAVISMGILLAMTNIATIGVFGVEITTMHIFPVLALSSYVETAGFIERLEALVLLLWVTGVVVKVGLIYYLSTLAIAQTFKLKDYKPIIFPVGLLTAAWSISFFENIIEVQEFLAKTLVPWAFSFEFMIPLALLLVAIVRKKGNAKKDMAEKGVKNE